MKINDIFKRNMLNVDEIPCCAGSERDDGRDSLTLFDVCQIQARSQDFAQGGGGTGHRCQGTPSKKGKLFGFGPLFFWGGGWGGAAVFIYHYFFAIRGGGHGPRAPLATSLAKYHIEKIDTHCAMMQTCPLSIWLITCITE